MFILKVTKRNSEMELFRCILLLSLTGLSCAANCAVHMDGSHAGPIMELCEYEEGRPLILTCRAVDKDESTPRCNEAINTGEDICDAKVTFEIFGQHEDPWKVYRGCPLSSTAISILINVKYSTTYFPIIRSQLRVNRLQINGGVMREQGEGKELEVGLRELVYSSRDVKHLTINNTDAGNLKLGSEQLQLQNLESLTLENIDFVGLSSSSINLQNVRDVNLINMGVGSQKASPAAIKWMFDSNCVGSSATFTMHNIRETRYFETGSIVSKGKECRIVRRLVVKDGDFYPVIPAKIFQSLIQADEINELTFDPIECCHTESSWLFKNIAKNTRLNIQCSDLGSQVSSLTGSRREEECKKRNVMPIYLIAIITVGSLALILTIFGSICFFYILPRQRAIHAKSHADSDHVSSDNHVLEMDSSPGKVSQVPKRSRSRSKKRSRHNKPLAHLNLSAKNSPTGKRLQATILKVNSLSDDEGRQTTNSQTSDTPTMRTQATTVPTKEAKSGVFHTLA